MQRGHIWTETRVSEIGVVVCQALWKQGLLPAVGMCLENDFIKCQKPKREHRLAAGFCFSSQELIRHTRKDDHRVWFI